MPVGSPLLPASLLLLALGAASGNEEFFADWGVIGVRSQEPTCVDIPENMPLCSGIDYTKMRLPNLLEHDTLKEAQQQAGYWVPLLNLRCHPDTQLFLCSLFTPVCLESPIYPCRSLCEAVRNGCESRMQTYSFPWPDMLRCDKFPLDNDMCITVQHTKAPGPEIVQDGDCAPCRPVETYENILDNFCRADVVVKTRVKKQRKDKVICKKARAYKNGESDEERRALRRPRFSLKAEAGCCTLQPSRTPYLIMARRERQELIPTFVMPFKKSKPLRKAIKKFRGLNCSDPKLITGGPEIATLSQEPRQQPPPHPQRAKKGRKKPKGRRGRKRVRIQGPPGNPGDPRAPGSNNQEEAEPTFDFSSAPMSPSTDTPRPPSPPPSLPIHHDESAIAFFHENEVEDHTLPAIAPPTPPEGGNGETESDDGDAEEGNSKGPGKRRGRKHGRRQRNKASRRERRRKNKQGEQEEPTAEP